MRRVRLPLGAHRGAQPASCGRLEKQLPSWSGWTGRLWLVKEWVVVGQELGGVQKW
jgi:hypothetical protein